MTQPDPSLVTPERITEYITSTFDGVEVLTVPSGSGTFFSLTDAHWPNFATLVTSDEYDQFLNLSRPEVYRLNIGLTRKTFESLFPTDGRTTTPSSTGSCPTRSTAGSAGSAS